MMMRKIYFIFVMLISCVVFAQNSESKYKKVFEFGKHNKDWAMVETVTKTYGFIDADGKEVVMPIYSKIYEFEIQKNSKKYAMVKNVADAYGFIDENGIEVIKAIYFKKEEAIQKLNIFLNGL